MLHKIVNNGALDANERQVLRDSFKCLKENANSQKD